MKENIQSISSANDDILGTLVTNTKNDAKKFFIKQNLELNRITPVNKYKVIFKKNKKCLSSILNPISFTDGVHQLKQELAFRKYPPEVLLIPWVGVDREKLEIGENVMIDIDAKSTFLPVFCKLLIIHQGAAHVHSPPVIARDVSVQIGNNPWLLSLSRSTDSARERRSSWSVIDEYYSAPHHQYRGKKNFTFEKAVQSDDSIIDDLADKKNFSAALISTDDIISHLKLDKFSKIDFMSPYTLEHENDLNKSKSIIIDCSDGTSDKSTFKRYRPLLADEKPKPGAKVIYLKRLEEICPLTGNRRITLIMPNASLLDNPENNVENNDNNLRQGFDRYEEYEVVETGVDTHDIHKHVHFNNYSYVQLLSDSVSIDKGNKKVDNAKICDENQKSDSLLKSDSFSSGRLSKMSRASEKIDNLNDSVSSKISFLDDEATKKSLKRSQSLKINIQNVSEVETKKNPDFDLNILINYFDNELDRIAKAVKDEERLCLESEIDNSTTRIPNDVNDINNNNHFYNDMNNSNRYYNDNLNINSNSYYISPNRYPLISKAISKCGFSHDLDFDSYLRTSFNNNNISFIENDQPDPRITGNRSRKVSSFYPESPVSTYNQPCITLRCQNGHPLQSRNTESRSSRCSESRDVITSRALSAPQRDDNTRRFPKSLSMGIKENSKEETCRLCNKKLNEQTSTKHSYDQRQVQKKTPEPKEIKIEQVKPKYSSKSKNVETLISRKSRLANMKESMTKFDILLKSVMDTIPRPDEYNYPSARSFSSTFKNNDSINELKFDREIPIEIAKSSTPRSRCLSKTTTELQIDFDII